MASKCRHYNKHCNTQTQDASEVGTIGILVSVCSHNVRLVIMLQELTIPGSKHPVEALDQLDYKQV